MCGFVDSFKQSSVFVNDNAHGYASIQCGNCERITGYDFDRMEAKVVAAVKSVCGRAG